MGDTVREKIMDNIVSTLEGITVAGGYANTIQSVLFEFLLNIVSRFYNVSNFLFVLKSNNTK